MRKDNTPQILSIAALLFFITTSIIIFNYVVDDSFISLVYARNLSKYGELAANIGERTFGYTNFLFVLVETGLIKIFNNVFLGYNIIIPVKVFLLICAALCLILPWHFTPIRRKPVTATFWFVSLASATPFIIWTSAGLETIFLAALLVITALAFLKSNLSSSPAHTTLSEIIMLTAGASAILTRLDAVLIIGPILLVHGLKYLWRVPRWWLKFLLFAVFPIATMLVFTFLYYGQLLPQPFYAKAFVTFKGALRYGMFHFLEFLVLMNANFIHLVFIAVGIKLAYSKKILNRFTMVIRAYIPVLAGAVIYIIYIISQGPIHMMYTYRFYTPLLPLLYMASAFSVGAILQNAFTNTGDNQKNYLPWEKLYIGIKKRGVWPLLTFSLALVSLFALIILKLFDLFKYFNNYFVFILAYAMLFCFSAFMAIFPQKLTFKAHLKFFKYLSQRNQRFILVLSIILLFINLVSFLRAYHYSMNFAILSDPKNIHAGIPIKDYLKTVSDFRQTGETIHANFPSDSKMYCWSAGIIPYLAEMYAFDGSLLATQATSKLNWTREDVFEPFDLIVMPCYAPVIHEDFELWGEIPETVDKTSDSYDILKLYQTCVYSRI